MQITSLEPEFYEKATKEEVWKEAMEKEIKMIEKKDMGTSRVSSRQRDRGSQVDTQNQDQS